MIVELLQYLTSNAATAGAGGGIHIFDMFTDPDMKKGAKKEDFPLSGAGGDDDKTLQITSKGDGSFELKMKDGQGGGEETVNMKVEKTPEGEIKLEIQGVDPEQQKNLEPMKKNLEVEINKYDKAQTGPPAARPKKAKAEALQGVAELSKLSIIFAIIILNQFLL